MDKVRIKETGTGRPSPFWLLFRVYRELFAPTRIRYTFLCMLAIMLIVIYIIVPGYYAIGVYRYNEKTMAEEINTGIIVNCANIVNPSSMFTEDSVEDEFLSDPRILTGWVHQEQGVTISAEGKDPFAVVAHGIIPEAPTTYEPRMVYGSGVSSLDAREIVITNSLFKKMWGDIEPGDGHVLNMSIKRTVDGKQQEENFRLNVIGVLRTGIWNRVYLPNKFVKHLNNWRDKLIDTLPAEGDDVMFSLPEPEYASGTMFIGSATPEATLKEECDYQQINIKKMGKPFYQIISEDNNIWFHIRPKEGGDFDTDYANIITAAVPGYATAEPMIEASNVDLYSRGRKVTAKILAISHEDSRISNVYMTTRTRTPQNTGIRVADIIDRGGVVVSHAFAKRLESLGNKNWGFSNTLYNGPTSLSNELYIRGVVREEDVGCIDGEWDILCGPEKLGMALHRIKTEKLCMVCISNPIVGFNEEIQENYGEEMDIMSEHFAEMLLFREGSLPIHSHDGTSITADNIEPPIGYEDLYAYALPGVDDPNISKSCVFVNDYTFDRIADLMYAKSPSRGAMPAIVVVSEEQVKGRPGHMRPALDLLRKKHKISVISIVYGNSDCLVFPMRVMNRVCPDATRSGFISRIGASRRNSETGYYGDVLSICNSNNLMKTTFLFNMKSGKSRIISYLKKFKSSFYHVADITYLPDFGREMGYVSLIFAIADDKDLQKFPFDWARRYAYMGKTNAFSDCIIFEGMPMKIGGKTPTVSVVRDEHFPLDTVLIPAKFMCNNQGLVKTPDKFNRIDVGCQKVKCSGLMPILEDIDGVNIECKAGVRKRKLVRYEFTDAKSNDGILDPELIPVLESRNPPFAYVKPNMTLNAEADGFKKIVLKNSSKNDPAMFSANLCKGNWINGSDSIVFPESALKGSTYEQNPESLIGGYVTVLFERIIKRSAYEPRLSRKFKVVDIVSGNVGYIPSKRSQEIGLWQHGEVDYIVSEDKFKSALDMIMEKRYSQVSLFVKSLDMVRPVSNELNAKGYTTHDSLASQESLRKQGIALAFIVVIVLFASISNGPISVTSITRLSKESRIHETGCAFLCGTSKKYVLIMFLLSGLFIGVGAYIMGVFFTISIEGQIRKLFQVFVSHRFEEMLEELTILDPSVWWLYVVAFIVSVGCCLFSVWLAFLSIRKLSVVDIYKKQF